MLATSLASAMTTTTYAEVIKRNATASTTAMAQNYLNKGTSSMADLSYSKLLSNGSKYSFITDATLLPILYSNWRATNVDSWYFYDSDGSVRTGWIYDNGWYYLSTQAEGTAGLMKYGWYQDSTGTWYFLNTVHDGTFGRAISGWQWIDGYSYYFDENCRLVVSGSTTDGYTVDSDGRWIVDGVVRFVEGKGLTNQIVYLDSSTHATNSAYTTSHNTSQGEDNYFSTSSIKQYEITYDYRDGQTIKTVKVDEGSFATEPEVPNRDGYMFLAWYENPNETDITNAFYHRETPIVEDKTLYAVWLDVTKDTDGDGLLDGLEDILGTDINNVDTDGDGLSDYDEYYITRSNPLNMYSLFGATIDSQVDIDEDGLTNIEELEYGSNPLHKDTDDDGLSDNEEKDYGTNPNIADTDSDGLADGLEITYGFNPLVSDTDGNGVLDGDEIISVSTSYEGEGVSSPLVAITLKAGGASNIGIERIDPKTSIWMPEEVSGLIDAAYDFHADGDIEEATLTFSFDEEQSDDFYPAIYYVDIENQEMEMLEDQVIDWDTKTVTAKTSHFSWYVVLNEKEQEKVWRRDIKSIGDTIDVGPRLEIVLAIDEFTDMMDVDPNNERIHIAEQIIDSLRDYDGIAIVGFAAYGRVYQAMTTDHDLARNALDMVKSDIPGKSMSAGIMTSAYQFEFDSRSSKLARMAVADTIEKDVVVATASEPQESSMTISDAMNGIMLASLSDATYEDTQELILAKSNNTSVETRKIIVLFTDGLGWYNEDDVQVTTERGIEIYAVSIGDRYYRQSLEDLTVLTGGKYYHMDELDTLLDDFRLLTGKGINLEKDTDNDGLSDYHEERIRFFNGMTISLDKENADTDGDGIFDGYEIEQTTDRRGRVFFKMYSNPHKIDSDDDGINDDEDTAPLVKGIEGGIVGKLYLVSCYKKMFWEGHTFFAYQSYVNDSIDFSGLANGWRRKDREINWTEENLIQDVIPTSAYTISIDEFVTIGNGGLGVSGSGSASSGSADSSSAADENGVNYNMEVYKFVRAGRPTNEGQANSYLANSYITEEITSAELIMLINYLSDDDVNYWDPIHNCARVATEGWNRISNTEVSADEYLVSTPLALHHDLSDNAGYGTNWKISEAFAE